MQPKGFKSNHNNSSDGQIQGSKIMSFNQYFACIDTLISMHLQQKQGFEVFLKRAIQQTGSGINAQLESYAQIAKAIDFCTFRIAGCCILQGIGISQSYANGVGPL